MPTYQSKTLPIFIYLLFLTQFIHLAYALPNSQTVTGNKRDVTVSLSMEEMFILDDQNIYCSISVVVVGDNLALTAGDTIKVKLQEDDWSLFGFGDDLPWESEEEVVSAEEASQQRFEREYDCSIAAFGDFIGGLEMYARVEIDKQECGSLCEFNPLGGEDNVETSRINMAHIDDDLAEDDDTSDTAFIGISVVDRVAKDADWFEVTYMQAVEFQALLKSNLAGGMLDMTLFDTMGVTLAQATVNETTGNLHFVDLQPLLAGTYYLQILPTVEDDFNFYDLTLMGSTLQTDCAPGEVQERACGLCGVERKTCSNDGEWEAWLPCAEQGVCEPGSVEIRNCGENGNQEKVCDNECQWGSFGNCIQCTDGESGVCYSGPADTRGVGVCVEGRRTCTGNTWSSCQGDGRPVLENCTDGEDNDCDGAVDRDDSDCIANLGDACLQSNECAADLVCLSAPFPDGYCGQEGCNNCNNGVCSRALGADWCLKPCNNLFDCRAGYLCVNVGLQGESVCAPPCMSDSDCGVNEACQEQICVGGDNPMAGMTMDNGEDEADTGGGAVSSPKDEGCQQTHHTSSTSLLIVLLLVSHLYIRRRDLDYESAKDLA